jgi:hypothetical protein
MTHLHLTADRHELDVLRATPIRRAAENPSAAWRALAYAAVFLPYLFLVAAAWIYPDWAPQQSRDWKPLIARAEESRESGDLYTARTLYVQAGRVAGESEDWRGLLAAACGVKKLDGASRAYGYTHSALVQAMVAAETRQSRVGIAAVAQAFAAIGEPGAAAMTASKARVSWPAATNEAVEVDTADCRATTAGEVDGSQANE